MSAREMKKVQVASGAGKLVCDCGWQSRVVDDGKPEYTMSDAELDFAWHVCKDMIHGVDPSSGPDQQRWILASFSASGVMTILDEGEGKPPKLIKDKP